MRDDVLDAQAAIDWAISDLPILERKIAAWRNSAPYKIRTDVDSQPGKKLFRLLDVKPIPAIINAEAGVILHAIRSSLDLLAVALAERNGHIVPKDVYFPIAKSRDAFFDPENWACKKIKRLGKAEVTVIENLQPWAGGNDRLFQMHTLDITRKHQRLLAAYVVPTSIIVDPKIHAAGGLKFISVWPGFKEDAVIGTGADSASEGDFVIALEVRFAEVGSTSMVGVIAALRDFAGTAQSIISLFDA